MSFSQLLSELGPPPEKLKSKKKKGFQILGPPLLRIPGHAPAGTPPPSQQLECSNHITIFLHNK